MCTAKHKHSAVFTGANGSTLSLMRRDKALSRQSGGRPAMPVTFTLLKGGKHQRHLIRQREKTESPQAVERPPGTLAENPAQVINLTPVKELTYGSDGRLAHLGLPIWALWKALVGFLLVPPALLPHIPEGGPAEGCSFPLSNILRSLDYLTCKSYVTHKVPQWASEVKILQILHKPSHLKATLMCWSCYPVTNVWISFLFFFFWVVIVSELIGVVQA